MEAHVGALGTSSSGDGVNIPPSRAAALIADIAAGRFDMLAGRLLRAIDDRELLQRGKLR